MYVLRSTRDGVVREEVPEKDIVLKDICLSSFSSALKGVADWVLFEEEEEEEAEIVESEVGEEEDEEESAGQERGVGLKSDKGGGTSGGGGDEELRSQEEEEGSKTRWRTSVRGGTL